MTILTDTTIPKTGMVLAAGLGKRMRPITDTIPKPLVPVHGRTLLDHAIDRLEAVGVETVVVNTHYLASQVTNHLAQRRSPRIEISPEDDLLETGGGVLKALPLLGESFFVINSDVLLARRQGAGAGTARPRLERRTKWTPPAAAAHDDCGRL